ncbi:hypothetical protein [Polyangium spumosum]|uniref:Uncharacterized protein n=1 Tax=Polyangium spumosum TaxID=889282 RepID=A0A6N7PTU8_9BACT|nr:hypothetical protein [Polyangium spumosum]MRG92231.1 hypothetical protein [Polyangium spumosum]
MTLLVGLCACAPSRPPLPAAPMPAASPPEQRVFVRIDADHPTAKLVEAREENDVPVCDAPCNRVIPVRKGARYHVEAFAARPTRSFELYSPHDPVVWLDVKTTAQSKYDTIHRIFIATVITSSALVLTGAIGTPLAEAKSTQAAFSATGFAGLVLLLPVSAVLGGISLAHSTSNLTFKDPRTRPDLRGRIR